MAENVLELMKKDTFASYVGVEIVEAKEGKAKTLKQHSPARLLPYVSRDSLSKRRKASHWVSSDSLDVLAPL